MRKFNSMKDLRVRRYGFNFQILMCVKEPMGARIMGLISFMQIWKLKWKTEVYNQI